MECNISSKFFQRAQAGLIALFALTQLGCAQSESDSGRDSTPVSAYTSSLGGKINGQNWSVRTGVARQAFGNSWSITLSEDNANDPCDLRPSRNSIARFTIENKIRRTNLGVGEPRKYVSLQYFKDNVNRATTATRGFIQLTEVNLAQSSIQGNLQASFNSLNSISGSFTVKICE